MLVAVEDTDAELSVLAGTVVDFLLLVVVTLVARLEENARDLDDVNEGKRVEDVFDVLDAVEDKLALFLLIVELTVLSRVEEVGNGFEEVDDDEVEDAVFMEPDVFCDELVNFPLLIEGLDEDLAIVLDDDDSVDFEEVDVNLVALNL